MANIHFETAWKRNDPRHSADATGFWVENRMINKEEAAKRVADLCSMAYADGKLVGVSTVNLNAYAPLRSNFAFYRCAVAPEFRRQSLAILLTRHTITTMEAWCLEHMPYDIQGVATILQAHELDEKARTPMWAEYYGNLNLVGFTAKGDQVRVAWFRHALLPS